MIQVIGQRPAANENELMGKSILLILLLISPVCAAEVRRPPQSIVYRHPEGAFRLRVPAAWKVSSNYRGKGVDLLIAPRRIPYQVIQIARGHFPAGPDTLDEMVEALSGPVPQTSTYLGSLANAPCVLLVQPQKTIPPMTLTQVLVQKNRRIYYIALIYPGSGWMPPESEAILESLEFAPSPFDLSRQ